MCFENFEPLGFFWRICFALHVYQIVYCSYRRCFDALKNADLEADVDCCNLSILDMVYNNGAHLRWRARATTLLKKVSSVEDEMTPQWKSCSLRSASYRSRKYLWPLFWSNLQIPSIPFYQWNNSNLCRDLNCKWS